MSMSIPDMPWPMMAGLCVPEKPIVRAQSETCWPGMGTGAGVAADAAPADNKRVLAARVVVTRMRTDFMIDAFRRGECAPSNPGPRLAVSFPAGILWCLLLWRPEVSVPARDYGETVKKPGPRQAPLGRLASAGWPRPPRRQAASPGGCCVPVFARLLHRFSMFSAPNRHFGATGLKTPRSLAGRKPPQGSCASAHFTTVKGAGGMAFMHFGMHRGHGKSGHCGGRRSMTRPKNGGDFENGKTKCLCRN